MKKSILVLVMGLCGTVVFAQNAKTEISQKEAEQPEKEVATKGSKTATEYQSSVIKKKLVVKKTMVATKGLMPAKLEKK